VLGCERRPVSASIMSRSCFASFPLCVYKFRSHYLNNIIFIHNSLGPLARDSPYICRGLSTGMLSAAQCSAAEHLLIISRLVKTDKVDPVLNKAPSFSTSAPVGGDWSPSHPGRFVLSPKLPSALL